VSRTGAAGTPAPSSPLATIVIAVYNGEQTVARAIESALEQTYEPLEVVVVDDGSTDASGEIARSFADVRYVHQENAGPSAARNRGIEEARGEYVAFLDADDEALPERMSLQVGFLLTHPEVACTLARQEVVDGGPPPEWVGRDAVFGDLAGIPLMTLVARRQTLVDAGGFDTTLRIAEDRDLLVRLRERGARIEVVPEVVLRRHFHGANLSFERSHDPNEHPLLRSLKAKLDRQRDADQSAEHER
jgi:glycosyltransferase involved in cell wall biosynthesis